MPLAAAGHKLDARLQNTEANGPHTVLAHWAFMGIVTLGNTARGIWPKEGRREEGGEQ